MEKGIKVAGGDRTGKTIVFAQNNRHAQNIVGYIYIEHVCDLAKLLFDRPQSHFQEVFAMKQLEAGTKKIICSNPDSPFRYFGWPSVIRLQDSSLAMVASGFRLKHICPFGKGIMSYSRDEGRNWTAPAVVLDTPLDDRDCGLAAFGSGRVMLTSFNNSIAAQRGWNQISSGEHKWSDDARRNLSEAYLQVLDAMQPEDKYLGSTYRISEDGGYTFGPIRHAPVTAPHGPCTLQDGSLLYVGRRFVSDDSFESDADTPFIQCWRWNGDDSFEYVSAIDNIYKDGKLLLSCEPHAIQLPDGKLIVHIRVQGTRPEQRVFTVYQSESIDGGAHFSKPHAILGELGGSPAHLLLHSSGTLISAYGYRNAPYGIRVMLSQDGGESWDTDYVLDADGLNGDLGYPPPWS